MKKYNYDPIRLMGILSAVAIIVLGFYYFIGHITITGAMPIATAFLAGSIAFKYLKDNKVKKTTMNTVTAALAGIAFLLNIGIGIIQIVSAK